MGHYNITKEEIEAAIALSVEKAKQDLANEKIYARKRGMEIGMEKGREIVRKKWREIGMEIKAREMANTMLKMNYPISEIATLVGLSIQEIEELKNKT
jgi:predicted transposase YdaD